MKISKQYLFQQKKWLKIVFIGLLLVLICLTIGAKSLNPFHLVMFEFHDETQAGRIHDFLINLKYGQIPPRLAPTFSFKLGFPVFSFYAPFAYWVTSFIAVTGIPILTSLKISFLLTLLLSFLTMYFLLRNFFSFLASCLGAVIYITSTYFAVEIIIRGNLAEAWYLVLLPLVLSFLYKNSQTQSRRIFFFTVISLFFLFTVHNIFSLLSLGITIVFSLLLPQKRRNWLAIGLGLLLGAYFLIPATLETGFTQATKIAPDLFKYHDHFLCWWQLWKADGWQFGGSMTGCDADLMSFSLGKIPLTLGLSGMILFIVNVFKKKISLKRKLLFGFVLLISLLAIFLTTYQSSFIWSMFKPILALFQFPWRFLIFGMFGLAFFSAFLFDQIKLPLMPIMMIAIIIGSLLIAKKYFVKPEISYEGYTERYLSDFYLEHVIAYNVREYFPAHGDYQYWHYLNPLEVKAVPLPFDYQLPVQTTSALRVDKNDYFEKAVYIQGKGLVYINVHYAPYWKILVNGQETIPDKFDRLARPMIRTDQSSQIIIRFVQTPLEKISNLLTVVTGIIFVVSLFLPKNVNKLFHQKNDR
ncbi:hypothetical protein A3F03_00625 [Candidatus Roizmanbacteria bacterium RIFCSPHIGHO2_12_FULL_41_11]|uniref:Membrane protein 6-pyruvoyl-tetrahydropterin synthase-related domain-containing protein n=2 Tax=Candidatus Roizmaniibacteriota TaxID=1752723 RepID=A0A1F7JAJ4_9BACT|nr:MAG: hypothetical protein A3F03_00625 [Candidatus Roizmanbacteria bacterium RIFCSPHIGHO2_12_FULL_41_11]OGK52623.1 MAG: hypothetical protein A2966_02155 [Candidatus Roizmanbacteria bacterium RIFCSPLOWO2_01_FULL_41_22]